MGGAGRRGEGLGRRIAAAAAVCLVGLAGAQPAAGQQLEEYDYANLGVRALGVEVIYVDATQNESTFGLGAKIDLGFLGPGVRVVPRFGFWTADVDGADVDALERQLEEVSELEPGSVNLGAIERSAYVLGVDFQYIAAISRVSPYVGAGIDIYALNDDGDAIRGTFLDDVVVTAGASAVGGVQVDVAQNWSVFGEFRATAVTDASSLGAAFGVYYRWGP
ncbi:MAG: outer membrane protein [Gemmatimonadota bacterium]